MRFNLSSVAQGLERMAVNHKVESSNLSRRVLLCGDMQWWHAGLMFQFS